MESYAGLVLQSLSAFLGIYNTVVDESGKKYQRNCSECGSTFSTNYSQKLTCDTKCSDKRQTRMVASAEHRNRIDSYLEEARGQAEMLSDWLIDTGRQICTYCGSPAEHEDHLLPSTYLGGKHRKSVPTVPSCADCNCRLNDVFAPLIYERCEILSERIRRKGGRDLERFIRGDRLSLEEIEELGPNLRSIVQIRTAKKADMAARLLVLESGGSAEFETEALRELTEYVAQFN